MVRVHLGLPRSRMLQKNKKQKGYDLVLSSSEHFLKREYKARRKERKGRREQKATARYKHYVLWHIVLDLTFF